MSLHDRITAVFAPHMGAEVGRERAAQLATAANLCPDEPPTEDEVRSVVRNANEPHYGGLSLCDDEVERLTQGVCLAMGWS